MVIVHIYSHSIEVHLFICIGSHSPTQAGYQPLNLLPARLFFQWSSYKGSGLGSGKD